MSYAYWMMVNVCNDNQTRVKLTPDEFELAKIIRKQIKTLEETKIKIGKSRKNKIAVFNSTTNTIKYIDQQNLPYYKSIGYIKGGRPKSEKHKKAISETNKKKGIIPKSIGWNKGLTKETSPLVAKATAHMMGKPAWNKGKKNTGFGDPNRKNPMKDPIFIEQMLKTRRENKEKNANKKI